MQIALFRHGPQVLSLPAGCPAETDSEPGDLALESDSEPTLVLESYSNPGQLSLESDSDPGDLSLEPDPAGAMDLDAEEFTSLPWQWADRLLFSLRAILGEAILRRRFAAFRNVSSHCSGLGTAELALQHLRAACLRVLNFDPGWETSSVCDNGRGQQQALAARLRGRCCIFADVLDIVPALQPFHPVLPRRAVASQLAPPAYSDMLQVAKTAPVSQTGRCVAHSSECLRAPAELDVSGSPCNSWTSEGLLDRQDSKFVAVTLAWCRWLLDSSLLIGVHENVKGFDKSTVLQDVLGAAFVIIFLRVSPGDAGFPFIRRTRSYAICIRRAALHVVVDIPTLYTAVSQEVSQAAHVSLSALAGASQVELLAEENAARARVRRLPPRSDDDGPSKDWTYLLNDRQQLVLTALLAQWQRKYHVDAKDDDQCVFMLFRSCDRSRIHSRGVIPTLTSGSSRNCWMPALGRWLLHRELAAAMGYPVDRQWALAARVDQDLVTSPPGAQTSVYMLGGAMHVANVGVVMAPGSFFFQGLYA